ncbi:YbaK/EbsC family protein [Streptomyces chattanoogensis]|uniref:YbaK/EbsC family protein n=1 Tax=Streptomyces chattanoogensis TaxID=66876 RepID=UPI0036C6BF4D
MSPTISAVDPASTTTYTRLISLLDASGCRYRLIDHVPEGRTDAASMLRGHPLEQAAKCLVVQVKMSRKASRYALAIVPGDRRVDLDAIRTLLGGVRAGFAPRERAEQLTGCRSGSIIPIPFHPELELIVDPGLLGHEEVFFNAARLDRSVALATRDYLELVDARVEPIATPVGEARPAQAE